MTDDGLTSNQEPQPTAGNGETKGKRPYTKKSNIWALRKEGLVNPKNPNKLNVDRGKYIPLPGGGVVDAAALDKYKAEMVKKLAEKDKDDKIPTLPKVRIRAISGREAVPNFDDLNLKNLANDMIEFMKSSQNFWLKDFFIWKGIPSVWIPRMIKANEYFAYCYQRALDIMESKFVKMGLKKRNPAFGMFALKQNDVAGWKDVQEVKSELSINTLSDVIKKVKDAEKKGNKVTINTIQKTVATQVITEPARKKQQ